ncbi:MAG TPA: LysR family transcriptional regulator [Vicinamibacterales bacterium]|jgi:DNA-binding transcriptional LysR family regulator|nr:LysR family transcriptional regulator [Vicinamibacterales bacterium]
MNINTVDLNLLVVFDALLAEGSVTVAARRLGLSQPAFSHALGRLRSALGDPLFERTAGGMTPTPRAVAMAVPVRKALIDLRRALATPVVPATPPLIVTIAANRYAQYLLLPMAIKALRRQAPTISLDVRDTSALGAADSRETDLALDWATAGVSGSAAAVLRDRLVGIARRSNAVVHGPVSPAMFERLDRIGVHYDPSSRSDAGADGHVVSDAVSAMCVVSQTDAVAVVPNRLAKQFAGAMGLKTFRLPDNRPDVVLQVAWNTEAPMNKTISTVRDRLVDAGAHLAGGRKK